MKISYLLKFIMMTLLAAGTTFGASGCLLEEEAPTDDEALVDDGSLTEPLDDRADGSYFVCTPEMFQTIVSCGPVAWDVAKAIAFNRPWEAIGAIAQGTDCLQSSWDLFQCWHGNRRQGRQCSANRWAFDEAADGRGDGVPGGYLCR